MSWPDQEPRVFYRTASVIVVAMALGVTLGFLDLALCLRNQPLELRSFSFALQLTSTTATLFFLAYVLAWLVAARTLLRYWRLHPVPLMSSIAVFFAVWFL